ncbi:MAG: hypothetical protein MZV64_06010 [Ignavibacteriales bacterium]|nr:hypothetical protein [Ignavibacteriales bacterium]
MQVVNGSGIGEGFAAWQLLIMINIKMLWAEFHRMLVNILELVRWVIMGKKLEFNNRDDTDTYYPTNEFWMVGGDATISFDPIELKFTVCRKK